MKRFVSLFLILLFILLDTFACDCCYLKGFWPLRSNAEMIALVRILKRLSIEDHSAAGYKNVDLEVEIIEVYKGTEEIKKVTSFHEVHFSSCRSARQTYSDVERLDTAEYYVMALNRYKDGKYFMYDQGGACWLRVDMKNQIAEGWIEGSTDSKMSLVELKKLIKKGKIK